MTEPSPARPLLGAPLPRPVHSDGFSVERPGGSFADLEQRPVSEHVGVFEAEHARLQRELGTIDSV